MGYLKDVPLYAPTLIETSLLRCGAVKAVKGLCRGNDNINLNKISYFHR